MKKQIFWGILEALAFIYFQVMGMVAMTQGDWLRFGLAVVFSMIVIKLNL